MQRRLHNFFGDNIIAGLNSVNVSTLQPLADTMTKALNSVGIAAPTELNDLTATFHANIVAPANAALTSGNIADNVLSFFQQQATKLNNKQPISGAELIVAKGANSALNTANVKSAFSNPLLWVGILVVMAFVIYLVTKK